MKKTLLFVSTLLLLIVLTVGLTVSASAEDMIQSGTWGSLTWTLNEATGELVISGEGSMNAFLYSSTSAWLAYKEKIKAVTIEEGVTSIGSSAFYGCSSLTSITIPDSVTSIGSSAFDGCSSLTSITIPDGVTSIGFDAFYGCSSLTIITIPNSVTSIGSSAFEGCSSLTSITIPDSVTSIGFSAFVGCSSLTSITIPNSVTSIGSSAFYGCSKLADVYITDVEAWLNISFGNKYSHPNCYGNLHILDAEGNEITELVIPNGVTSIGSSAFEGCSSLTSITIPNSVTSIGECAFYDCSNLTSITIPDSVTSIGSYAFKGCQNLISVTIPNSVTSIGSDAFHGCYKLVEIINHSSLELTVGNSGNGYVAYYALEVHSGESKLDQVGDFVFYSCNGVNYLVDYRGNATDLVLPANYNGQNYEIYKYAFSSKNDITSITIPESVRKIHQYAFGKMPSLEKVIFNAIYCADMSYSPFGSSESDGFSVEFGAKVAKIPAYLFYNCNVTNVIFANNCICSEIGKRAFYGCNDLVTFVVPGFVTTIGSYAFYDCYNLVSVTLGSSVNTIQSCAFQNCYRMTEVINRSAMSLSVGNSSNGYVAYYVLEVHSEESSKLIHQNGYLFYPKNGSYYLVSYVGNETELALPADCNGQSVYMIHAYAFYKNTSITSVVIPKDVLSISNYAFAYCGNLESVRMGDGMVIIYSYAFAYNDKLTSVVFGEGFPGHGLSIGDYAFYDCDGLVTIELPSTTSSIGSNAFYSCGKLEHITIGDDATSIGSYAFQNCSALKSIKIGANITNIGSSAFDGCTNLKIIYINSPTFATALTSATACGSLISNAEVILVEKSITNLATFVTVVFSYTEELNYEGTDYISYSLHTHAWERVQCEQDRSKCTSCGLLKGNTSPAHNYTPHAANDADYHWDVCADCGAIDNKILHSWNSGEVTTPATHISTGVMTYTCGVCGRTYTEVIEKIAEHNYGEWINTVDPGCSNTGTLAHYHCECGLDFDIDKNVLEDLTIPARGHYVSQGGKEMVDSYIVQNDATYPFALSDSWYASSNRMDNTTSVFEIRATYDCTLVLKYKVSSESSYDKLIILYNATTKDTISGSVSEKTLTLTLKAGDVVYIKYTKNSSSSSGADTGWFKIESCTQTEIDTTVYVSTDDVDPTCTNAVICESCHQTMKEALGHTDGEIVVENTVDPTCTEKGSYDNVVYCTVCNAELSRNTVEIPANGHSFGDWYEIQAPTCTATGTDERECAVCHTKETRTTDALGHTESEAVVENKVDATCTADGSYDSVIYCSVCKAEVSREARTIGKLGHEYESDWTVDVEPTCTEKGSKSHHCSRCEDKADVTEIPANGHSYGDWTAHDETQHKRVCACGEAELADHVYDNDADASCNDCGATKEIVTEALDNSNTNSDSKKSGYGAIILSGFVILLLIVGIGFTVLRKRKI